MNTILSFLAPWLCRLRTQILHTNDNIDHDTSNKNYNFKCYSINNLMIFGTRHISYRHNQDPPADTRTEDRPSTCGAPVHWHGGLLRQDITAGGGQGTVLRVSILD